VNRNSLHIDIVIPAKNGGQALLENIELWMLQKLPEEGSIHIYLVNDGSTDGTPEYLKEKYSNHNSLTIINNTFSQGRSKAINQGAALGKGEFVALFDADCVPTNDQVILNLINKAIKEDLDIVFGDIICKGQGFWARYFNDVMTKRRLLYSKGDKAAFTTANIMIKRKTFKTISGFDERFTKYGFEDKDFLLRAIKHGASFSYTKDAQVSHSNLRAIKDVCAKMYDAGKYTSTLFKEQHPAYYRETLFYKADASTYRAYARYILIFLYPMRKPILLATGLAIGLPTPYTFKKLIVKCCSGLFFAFGSLKKEI
tara:strand:+ start:1616 stop:2554 length:939 start_codon:yes stop_codon:yes gene_type:complete